MEWVNLEGMFAVLQGNPYFEAGFGLSVFGTALAAARGSVKGLTTIARRHFLVTLEVTSKDRAYPWVLAWLTQQASSPGALRIGSAATTLAQHVSVRYTPRTDRPQRYAPQEPQ